MIAQNNLTIIRNIISELRQRAVHDSSKKLTNNDLFILYDKNNDLIKFLIKTPESFKKSLIPTWKGVNFDFESRNGIPFIELSISDDIENDKIFKELIVRIIDDQNNVKNEIEAFDAFLNTLNSFDSFFKNQKRGLSKVAQQGLYAELFFLKNHIITNSEIVSYAINNWRGPERAHQDFRFERGNIEVKSTMQKDPINISITNEKQLDPRPLESINNKLFLYVLCLDEINPKENTLPTIIDDIYTMLDNHNSADRSAFTNRLNTAGYYEMHEEYYKDIGYYVRKELLYNVNTSIYFPSITDLPSGVGDIKYTIDLSACTSSKIDIKEIKDIL
tara:strand:- start:3118 stop:4113 length:996 start_codon:yes stop_codon:yes gene_type:complete